MLSSRTFRFASVFAGLVMAFSMVAIDHADARRGGSFGSRGTRTFQSAPSTRTAPSVAPVQRTMTPNAGAQSTAANRNLGTQRPGFMNGFGGSLLRGLAIGGLFGLLLGHGFGGMAGMFGLLLQILLIGGAIWLAMRFFRSRQGARPAMAGAGGGYTLNRSSNEAPRSANGGLGGLGGLAGLGYRATPSRPANPDEIGVGSEDLDRFEAMLGEIQDAYGREDYGTLRRLTTPEMMSYLSEELGSNASKGLRNDVLGRAPPPG